MTYSRVGRALLAAGALVIGIAGPATVGGARTAEGLALVPLPQRVEQRSGWFTLSASTVIFADPSARALGRQLAAMLAPATGFDLTVRSSTAPGGSHIALRLNAANKALGAEGYRLEVTPRAIVIRAAAPAGVFYGMQTLRQLLPVEIYREAKVHSQAVVAAYPELGSVDEPVEVRATWSVSPYILNPRPETITFMQNVLEEVLELFPGQWIHIGGDEAEKSQWKANPEIQARIKALGLKDEHELQSWFIRQMDSFLTARKRRLIGWDEILEGGLAENATVMAWRGVEHAVTAARAGHDAVLAPTSHTYFDYYQSRDTAKEPRAIGGFLPLERVYAWEPMPPDLEPQFRRHILGVQGQVWTEHMPNPKTVEFMAFPRASALAEVAWSPATGRSFEEFQPRLAHHLERLRILDVGYRPLDQGGRD